jgi:hypothetical protein
MDADPKLTGQLHVSVDDHRRRLSCSFERLLEYGSSIRKGKILVADLDRVAAALDGAA